MKSPFQSTTVRPLAKRRDARRDLTRHVITDRRGLQQLAAVIRRYRRWSCHRPWPDHSRSQIIVHGVTPPWPGHEPNHEPVTAVTNVHTRDGRFHSYSAGGVNGTWMQETGFTFGASRTSPSNFQSPRMARAFGSMSFRRLTSRGRLHLRRPRLRLEWREVHLVSLIHSVPLPSTATFSLIRSGCWPFEAEGNLKGCPVGRALHGFATPFEEELPCRDPAPHPR